MNFKYGTSGQKSMFGAGDRTKMVESKARGLRPLFRFLERLINKHIRWPINPEFSIELSGLEIQTPKEMADLSTQRVRTIYTIDEMRAEADLPPLPDGMGAVILDANWMAAKRQREQVQAAEQAAAQASAFGMAQDAAAPQGPQGAQPQPAQPPQEPASASQIRELESLLQPNEKAGRKSFPGEPLRKSERSVIVDLKV